MEEAEEFELTNSQTLAVGGGDEVNRQVKPKGETQ